ncbi:MAG: hypothetical protein MHM6MM_006800 [Cercozoa sp. M6MM]
MEEVGAQHGLEELQQAFRGLEATRRTFADECGHAIRAHRQKIEKLKQDNARIREELALETSHCLHSSKSRTKRKQNRDQSDGDIYQRKVSIEKEKIATLDTEIEQLRAKILEQRKKMGGVDATSDSNKQVLLQIRLLENRLERALTKYNEALGQNKKLRETIDNLRRERAVFDGIYAKLNDELQEKKRKMVELVDITSAAYEARKAAVQEMATLKAKCDAEQAAFEKEWAKLTAGIEKNRKLREFITAKRQEHRKEAAVLARSERAKNVAQTRKSASQLQVAAKDVSVGAWAALNDRRKADILEERIKTFEDAFKKLEEEIGTSDPKELSRIFEQREEENFALFCQVGEVRREVEFAEDRVKLLERQIEAHFEALREAGALAKEPGESKKPMKEKKKEFRGETEEEPPQREPEAREKRPSPGMWGNRARVLSCLEKQTKDLRRKIQAEEKTKRALEQEMGRVKEGVAKLLEVVYSPDEAKTMIGAGVDDSNVMDLLARVEQTVFARTSKKSTPPPPQLAPPTTSSRESSEALKSDTESMQPQPFDVGDIERAISAAGPSSTAELSDEESAASPELILEQLPSSNFNVPSVLDNVAS